MFHQDNVRPHCLHSLSGLCMDLKGIFCHPPYSLDIAPSDFYLYRICCYILLMLFITLHKMSKMKLICFWICNQQIFGSKVMKNYQNIGIKLQILEKITTCTKGAAFMLFNALHKKTFFWQKTFVIT